MRASIQNCYTRYAARCSRYSALLLYVLIWPLGRVGLLHHAAASLRQIWREQLRWIGPRHGAGMGLCSRYRLQQRMALLQDSETECDQQDANSRSWGHDSALLLRYVWSLCIGRKTQDTVRRWHLLGLWIDNLSHQAILQQLQAWRGEPDLRRIAFVNPHCANTATGDALYRSTLNSADLLLPDGSGVLLASRMLGTPLQENTNGTDLFPILCKQWQQQGARLYLLGGKAGVAEEVARHLLQTYPGLHIAGTQHGYFSAQQTEEVIDTIKTSAADVLVVAMGIPLQDIWIAQHQAETGVPLALGVGGLFDFLSQRIERAPLWLRELGLEWSWRLLQEPRRLWKRYLIGNGTFLLRVLRQKLGANPRTAPMAPPSHTPRSDAPCQQGVLLCEQNLWQDSSMSDPYGDDLMGHSVLEMTVIRMVEQGVTQLEVIADQGFSAIEQQLGGGERWGIQIRHHLSGSRSHTEHILANLTWHGHVWLVVPGCLPGQTLPALPCQWLLNDGSWAGWAYVSPAQLRTCRDARACVAAMHSKTFKGIALRSAAEMIDALPKLLAASPSYLPQYVEISQQVWVAQDAVIDPTARLQGPLLIGPRCVISENCQIGPNVIIGAGSALSRNVECQQSWLQAHSYISRDLSLSLCIVRQAQLHLVSEQLTLRFSSNDYIVDDLAASPVRIPLKERLQALALWAYLRLQHCRLDPARWPELARGLKQVWRGECHLIGIASNTSNLNYIARRPILRTGAIRLSSVLPPSLPAPRVSRAEQDFLTDLYGASVPHMLTLAQTQRLLRSLIKEEKPADFAIRT